MGQFDEIQAIDGAVKDELRPAVAEALARMSSFAAATQTVEKRSDMLIISGYVVGSVIGPFAGAVWLSPELSWVGWVAAATLGILVLNPLLAYFALMRPVDTKWVGDTGYAAYLLIAAIVALAGAYVLSGIDETSVVLLAVVASLAGFAAGVIVVFGVYIVLTAAEAVIDAAAIRQEAQGVATEQLVYLVWSVENEAIVPTIKADLMRALERVARAVQYELATNYRSGNTATDAWMQERARGNAAALRHEMRAIFDLRRGEEAAVARRLSRDLYAIVNGECVMLKTRRPEIDNRPWYRRASVLVVTLIRATIPLATVLAVRTTSDVASGSIGDTLVALALGWAAVTLLSHYDPQFSEKLAYLKSGSELTRRGK